MTRYAEKLGKAKTLTVEFSLWIDDGSPASYSVSLTKPNLARIDSPDTLIVLDGTNETTYYKKQGAYLVAPQLDSVVRSLFKTDELALFAPFFDAGMLKMSAMSDMGVKEIDGKDCEAVSMPLPGMKDTAVAMITKDDGLLQRATISGFFDSAHADQHKLQTCQLKTTSIVISGGADRSLYAFQAPKGARRISLADIPSDTWYTDLDLAGAVAAATNRRIFVDFMASWCGPCHQLHDQVLVTDDFRALSRYFVFVQIDVDEQKKVATNYKVTAMPTQMILDSQGTVLGKTVGYGGPNAFYKFLSKFAGG